VSVRIPLLAPRRALPIALTCGLLVLAGCGAGDQDTAPASSTDGASAGATGTSGGAGADGGTTGGGEPADGSPADGSPAEDTDAVQTDAPAETASLVVARAEWSADASAIETAAFVQGLVETGGECTATAEPEDGDAVTGDATEAEAGPATTECGLMTVVLPAGSTGEWAVTVSYTSGSTELTSETVPVDVP
jgi:hypothetical protein